MTSQSTAKQRCSVILGRGLPSASVSQQWVRDHTFTHKQHFTLGFFMFVCGGFCDNIHTQVFFLRV